ncbi:MAG: response regulator [Ectothiorhodospiraceae bacterium]|nr:response regulator [Ectothiorhodospiraceae bacterium]
MLLAVAAPVLTGAALVLFLMNQQLASIGQQLEHRGEQLARQLAPASRPALATGDRAALQQMAEAALGDPEIRRVILLAADGSVLAEQQRSPDDHPFAPLLTRLYETFSGRDPAPTYQLAIMPHQPILYFSELMENAGRPVGWVLVDTEVWPVMVREFGGMGLLAGSMLVALAVSLLLGLWTRRQAVAPLGRLGNVVRRLGAGDLRARVHLLADGEIAGLARDVNRMAIALEHSHQALNDQIEQATRELRETLEAVEIQNVELDIARKRALEGSKVKSEFLANMSHEIRTPINGILGFSDLLSHSRLDDEQRDYVNTIRESCANLLSLVNDILDFSRMEAGKLVIDNVAFDLRDCVEEVMSLMAPAAYGKSLELIHLVYSDVPLKLYGDPIRIRQVLTNLVHNAIKFTPRGRVVVRLMLEEADEREALLRVTVTDTGIGLSPNDQDKLFNAFSQADTSITRRFGGAGLGLIICKKLLEQMGGDIGLESMPDQGSTFWFTLRCARQPGVDASEKRMLSRDNPAREKRALLYDESVLSRLAARHLFESWGMKVTEAEDRGVFMSLIQAESRWDVAVIGQTREELNARVFGGLMNRLPKLKLPIIVLASTVDRNELRSLFQQGAFAALPKASRRQTLYREMCRAVAPEALLPQRNTGDDPTRTEAKPEDHRDVTALVADDNAINRKLVCTILRRHGVQVHEAENGLQAVTLCKGQDYDLILMDIHMPTMSGETAAARIRRHQGRKRKPSRIVAITANAMHGERERLLQQGMDDCLIKPVSEAQILAQVRECSARSREQLPSLPSPDAGDDQDTRLTNELRDMLLRELPGHKRAIQRQYRQGDLEGLRQQVHKLHGAASVCQVPELKAACHELEQVLIRGERVHVPGGVSTLLERIHALVGDTEPDRLSGSAGLH